MTTPTHPDWERARATWPNAEASQFVEAGRVRWHVQRMGAGPSMLLLHGSGAATHTWRDLLPLLAQDFDVIAPDLPGHGYSRIQSRRQCALPAMAEATAALVAQLQVRPAIVTGHSAGAAIALWMALKNGLDTNRIVGLNAALTPFRGMAGVLFPPLAKALALNPFVPWMFSSFAGSKGQAGRLIDSTGSKIDDRGLELYASQIARSSHVDGALSMMALWDLNPLLEALPTITLPVDLYVGEDDTTIPPVEALTLAEEIPAITAHRIADLGHLMHEEEPARFAGLLKDLA